MTHSDEMYSRLRDQSGEEFYCPVTLGSDAKRSYLDEIEACVEVSTVARYSGNLNVIDRF